MAWGRNEAPIDAAEGEQTIALELLVAESDTGKVTRKQGRTAQSIRNIPSAAGMKLKKRGAREIQE